MQDLPRNDDDDEAELVQWFKDNVKSIKLKKVTNYVTKLVGVGIDSVSRLLQVANDPSDEYIKSVIKNPFDFEDFNKAVSILKDIGSHATNPDILVSINLS